MFPKNSIALSGFVGVVIALFAVVESGAQPGGMMQKKEMMMKMMGKMQKQKKGRRLPF